MKSLKIALKTMKQQEQSRNVHAAAERTSHSYTTQHILQSRALTKQSSVNPEGNTAPSRLVIWLPSCAGHAGFRRNVAKKRANSE
jgi:hypothetical protein